jgi:DNA-binding Lrp family transcriptional regulator
MLDDTDRLIVNQLQNGFPIAERPFAVVGAMLGLEEEELISRLQRLKANGVLSRFGPLFNAERLGGHTTLAAMAVPAERVDEVAATVNAFPEVAHNYLRDHTLSMWFVVSAETAAQVQAVLTEVQARTGITAHDMPKLREFHLRLRLEA